MESSSPPLSLNTVEVDSWSLWVTIDPRVRVEAIGASQTSVKTGLFASVVGLPASDVCGIVFPLRGTVTAKDVVIANAEHSLPGFGAVLIEQLIRNNVLLCSRYCPLSLLYGRIASERTPLGIAEARVDTCGNKQIGNNWSLPDDFQRSPSCRHFEPKALADHQIGSCLRAAYGSSMGDKR